MKSAQELNSLALEMRRQWGEDGYVPIDIFAIVNGWKEKKITIVRYPLSKRISGRVICDMSMGDDKSDSKREADMFAGYLLMPYDALFQYSNKFFSKWSLEQILSKFFDSFPFAGCKHSFHI